ncbi:MAG: 50S ribosomal protein L11 methyltransferase [Bacteriovoracaceae bacterium]|nr:50S ribosomal protein L11 methyltransferase [Bacteriovoracaceae bacterium]
MEKYFYIVFLENPKNGIDNLAEIMEVASRDYGCHDIEEYVMEQREVDSVLGEKALVSDEIPEEVLDKIEKVWKQKEKAETKFIFYGKNAEDRAEKFNEYIGQVVNGFNHHIEQKKWEDWNTKWRRYYSPIEISPELKVYPVWDMKEKETEDQNIIYINPGMGFGTGYHETTWLCLKIFDDLLKGHDDISGECLDFGCGSGILGISVIRKLGIPVTFCDVDVDAMDNCLENITINFKNKAMDQHSLIIRKRMNKAKKYKLIFANILQDVLLDEKVFLQDSLDSDGYLIISGILEDQCDTILKNYNRLELVKEEKRNEWRALLLRLSPRKNK